MGSVWIGILFLPLLAASCAGLETTVKTRAAQDFRCSQDELKIVDRVYTVFRIAGCGSEATYVCRDTRSLKTLCEQADWEQPGRNRAQL